MASIEGAAAQAARALPQLRSRSQEVAALQMSLEGEIEQHKKARDRFWVQLGGGHRVAWLARTVRTRRRRSAPLRRSARRSIL